MVVPQELLGKGLTETIIPPILADTHFMGMAIETTVSPRDRILGALDKLPPFSPVLTRLLATLADEDVSFGELAAIIETDAVLAGNLLRVVNSPLYGRMSAINSVRHAVSILGSIKIRNLVLGLSVSRRWATSRVPPGWSSPQFNTHSLAVAVLSDLIALETPTPYPEGAFTCGLLHDVGKLLIAVAMPEGFEALHKAYASGGDSADDIEWSILSVMHAEISGAIMKKWKLPEPIQKGVEFHHSPDEADHGSLHLAHVVEAADHYINSSGLGMPFYRRHPVAAFEDCDRKFGLKDCTLKVAEAFKTEFEAVRTFF
jgi:HD-like signal output (HDOD) protein